MRKLINSLFIVILLLVVIIFGTPLVMGFWIQANYQSILNRISNPPSYKIEVVNFHRGWFSSDAQLRLLLNTSNAEQTLIPIDINDHIIHGPVIFIKDANNKSQVLLARALMTNNAQTSNARLNSRTVWTLNNQVKGNFQADQISVSNQTQQTSLSGANVDYFYDLNTQHLRTKLQISEGDFSTLGTALLKETFKLKFENVKSDDNFHIQDAIWYGARNLNIDHIGLQLPNNKSLDVYGVLANATNTQKSDGITTDIRFNLSTNKITGTNFNADNVQLNLAFEGLDTQTFSDLLKKAIAIKKQNPNKIQESNALYTPMLNFLGKGFTVNLNQLHFDTNQGSFDLNAQIQLPQQTGTPSLEAIAQQGTADANLTVAKQLLLFVINEFNPKQKPQAANNATTKTTAQPMSAEQQLDQWIKAQILIPMGANLQLKLAYQKGQLLINGKPLQEIMQSLQQTTSTTQPAKINNQNLKQPQMILPNNHVAQPSA